MERLAPALAVQVRCGRAPPRVRRTHGVAGGLAEDRAGRFQGWGSKHYHGHRERLRKRFLEGGAAAVADYELLELLLFFSVYRRDTKPIAKAMLAASGAWVPRWRPSPAALAECMGEVTADAAAGCAGPATTTSCSPRCSSRRPTTCSSACCGKRSREREAINSPEALRAYLQLAMRHDAAEHVRVLFLDRKDRLIRDEVQGRGTVDQAPLYPREVVKRALELGASAVVLVHNHPSGDPTPSKGGHGFDTAGGGGAGTGRISRSRPSDRRS